MLRTGSARVPGASSLPDGETKTENASSMRQGSSSGVPGEQRAGAAALESEPYEEHEINPTPSAIVPKTHVRAIVATTEYTKELSQRVGSPTIPSDAVATTGDVPLAIPDSSTDGATAVSPSESRFFEA